MDDLASRHAMQMTAKLVVPPRDAPVTLPGNWLSLMQSCDRQQCAVLCELCHQIVRTLPPIAGGAQCIDGAGGT
jgi:hypothetical protein